MGLRKKYPHIPTRSWWIRELVVHDSPIHGKGVFTTRPIKQGEVVIKWGGAIMSIEEFYAGKGLPHTNVGIDEGVVLAEPADHSLGVDDYMNHSCDPNLWLVDEVTLVAKRDIDAGEELTIDYAIELPDESYAMRVPCNCGSKHCRKQITGSDWRLEIVQRINQGHFSPFIERRIKKLKQGSQDTYFYSRKEDSRMNALITGGSRGIGKAIAIALAQKGYDILLVARNQEKLEEVARDIHKEFGVTVEYYACDVGRKEHIRSLYKFCKHKNFIPDVLVLNAGIFIEGTLTNSADEDFERTMEVDFATVYYTVKTFYPAIKEKPSPKIILIGSTAAYEPYPVGALYGVAKWALRGFAINLRQEMMQDGIAVTFLAPGGTLTDMWEGEILPPKRLLEPQDIGKLVAAITELSEQAVVEELIVRPMLGDIHE